MQTSNPRCCGTDATFVTISPTSQYYYCRECKKEVPEGGSGERLSSEDIASLNPIDVVREDIRRSFSVGPLSPEKFREIYWNRGIEELQEIAPSSVDFQKFENKIVFDTETGGLEKRKGWTGPQIASRNDESIFDEIKRSYEVCNDPNCICAKWPQDVQSPLPPRSRKVSPGLYLVTFLNNEIAAAPISKIPTVCPENSSWIEAGSYGHFEGSSPSYVFFVPGAQW